MPALNKGETVLVTGASGFVGTTTILALLDAGFKVRGAVRDTRKANFLKNLNKDIETVIVGDMLQPGAWDEAVRDVHGVLNIGSPMVGGDEPASFIDPSVKSVKGLLASIDAFGNDVKRVAHCSSTMTVADDQSGPRTVDEKGWGHRIRALTIDWDEKALRACQDGTSTYHDRYAAGKIHMERAFNEFFTATKRRFDGTTLCPALILGPAIQYTGEGVSWTGSVKTFLGPWLEPGRPDEELEKQVNGVIDVRDLAAAFVNLLVTSQPAERYILCGSPLFTNDFAMATAGFPQLQECNHGKEALVDGLLAKALVYNGQKAEADLNISYRPKAVTLRDSVADLLSKK